MPSPHQLSWLNYPQSHKPRQGGALPKLELENKRESIPAFLSADKGLSCCCTQVVITFKKAADAQFIEYSTNATQIKQLNPQRTPQNQGSHVGLEAGKCLNTWKFCKLGIFPGETRRLIYLSQSECFLGPLTSIVALRSFLSGDANILNRSQCIQHLYV